MPNFTTVSSILKDNLPKLKNYTFFKSFKNLLTGLALIKLDGEISDKS